MKQKPQQAFTKADIEVMQKQVDTDQAKSTKANPYYTNRSFSDTIRLIVQAPPPKKK